MVIWFGVPGLREKFIITAGSQQIPQARSTPTPTMERTVDSRSQLKNVRSFARLNSEFGKAYRSDHGPRTNRCQRVPEEGIRLSLVV
jgi:hypothetical protein